MLGLKESKVAIFDIIYHIWDEVSGHAWIDNEDTYDKDYILGLGTEELAHAMHDPVKVAELDDEDLEVWLEYYENGKDADPEWIFNKKLEKGVFSDPVVRVTEDDADDVNLYAKWVQSMYRLVNEYEAYFDERIAEETEVFSIDTNWTVLEVA